MQDGLYKVAFSTPKGTGAGVVVLSAGKMLGGDSSIFYKGTYTETGDQFTAEVQTDRHTPGLPSVFGRDKVRIVLKGTIAGDSAKMTGSSPDVPGVTFEASLKRLPD